LEKFGEFEVGSRVWGIDRGLGRRKRRRRRIRGAEDGAGGVSFGRGE
jgi:hypothetical protein